ncbi:MAG: PDDEXK nuclease domain-containing protein [Ignavibacteriales bacterium]|nr:PDDEXK nuclease domain-containing protein [Ignavibacteriales bacterium]MCF8316464.1 PDDEXK nuclease domain-containing protein [Ignavibacteriales bacterium]MCF8437944.1 PDDEXK nuclease domain-containing protein [Ignavibacteriales bacterium]
MSKEIIKSDVIEDQLLAELSLLIEKGKNQAVTQVNSILTLTYWQVGKKINEHFLKNKRAEYGQQIVATLSAQLTEKFGKGFNGRNIRRMMLFSEVFPDFEIVATLSPQLSWSHFTILISLKSRDAMLFYADKITKEKWSVRETQYQMERKAFERKEIASLQLQNQEAEVQNSFKDPYFLEFLELKDTYIEKDLEAAILRELESFLLELGKGFTFVERQKRITIDGEDFYLDLLFFHRKLKRLVAIELKIGKFRAKDKGQMELYLKWLNKYEKQNDEEAPIGLILCTEASKEQIELLEMHNDGIMVAEYWTELPPKRLLEEKLHKAVIEVKERLARKELE